MAKNEFKIFDKDMRKILSVSRDELKRREGEWKKKKRKSKTSALGRASCAKD
jgi:hypothetical protein